MMQVRVRYFAALREALGDADAVQLDDGATVADLRRLLLARGGRHAEVLAPARPVRAALNQVMARDDAVIPAGAEVAFFPPVTGG